MLLLGLLVSGQVALAQKPGQKPASAAPVGKEPSKDNPKFRQITITPEREAAVISFVERNHSELAELLAHLKTNQPKEYERAVKDLFRVTEKLAMVHERDSRLYDQELKVWKAQSRAQLLVARMKMGGGSSDQEELKKQLRDILTEQWAARLEVLRLERERISGRLNKLDQDISRQEQERDSAIESHLQILISAHNSAKTKNKPLDKNPKSSATSVTEPASKKPNR